jgi:hypothetical protein
MATSRADRVAVRIADGDLPREPYARIIGDYGAARACDGCEERATRADFVLIVEYRVHRPLAFHHECFLAWLKATEPA